MSSNRLEQLFQFLKESPDDSFITFAIAKEYESLEEQDKALEYYLKLVEKAPNYVGTYYHLAKLYERKNQPKIAFQTYSKGMQIAKQLNDQHALSELAGARLNLGDEEDFE